MNQVKSLEFLKKKFLVKYLNSMINRKEQCVCKQKTY